MRSEANASRRSRSSALHLLLGASRARSQRLHELRDGGLALLQCALGDDLIASQRLARELQEHLAVGAQGLARQRVERGAQALLGLLQCGQRARSRLSCGCLAAHALAFQRDLQRLFLPLARSDANEKAEREPHGERARARVRRPVGNAQLRSRCTR